MTLKQQRPESRENPTVLIVVLVTRPEARARDIWTRSCGIHSCVTAHRHCQDRNSTAPVTDDATLLPWCTQQQAIRFRGSSAQERRSAVGDDNDQKHGASPEGGRRTCQPRASTAPTIVCVDRVRSCSRLPCVSTPLLAARGSRWTKSSWRRETRTA